MEMASYDYDYVPWPLAHAAAGPTVRHDRFGHACMHGRKSRVTGVSYGPPSWQVRVCLNAIDARALA